MPTWDTLSYKGERYLKNGLVTLCGNQFRKLLTDDDFFFEVCSHLLVKSKDTDMYILVELIRMYMKIFQVILKCKQD